MLVEDVGEFRLIEVLAEALGEPPGGAVGPGQPAGTPLGIGDDAAAWDAPATTTVLTTDTLVEGVHFHPAGTGWRALGWKAMAVNMSDVAAMGCVPLHSTVTLGLRGDLPVEGLREMYRGMRDACQAYGGSIVGGDTVRSPTLFVTVAMVGHPQPGPGAPAGPPGLMTRGSAKPGDRIAVTGSLGCAAGGLRLIAEARGSTDHGIDKATEEHLGAAHKRPSPRVTEGTMLARLGVLAAIDISDGLVDDLGKLCRASGAGARVEAGLVPVDKSLKSAYPEDWLSLALAGGEDYELLFTAPQPVMDRAASELGESITVIGDVVSGPPGVRVVDAEGRDVTPSTGGWEHFREG